MDTPLSVRAHAFYIYICGDSGDTLSNRAIFRGKAASPRLSTRVTTGWRVMTDDAAPSPEEVARALAPLPRDPELVRLQSRRMRQVRALASRLREALPEQVALLIVMAHEAAERGDLEEVRRSFAVAFRGYGALYPAAAAQTQVNVMQVQAQNVERRLTVFEGLKRAIDRGIITLDTAHAIEATMDEEER